MCPPIAQLNRDLRNLTAIAQEIFTQYLESVARKGLYCAIMTYTTFPMEVATVLSALYTTKQCRYWWSSGKKKPEREGPEEVLLQREHLLIQNAEESDLLEEQAAAMQTELAGYLEQINTLNAERNDLKNCKEALMKEVEDLYANLETDLPNGRSTNEVERKKIMRTIFTTHPDKENSAMRSFRTTITKTLNDCKSFIDALPKVYLIDSD